jgi:hypothetical protein
MFVYFYDPILRALLKIVDTYVTYNGRKIENTKTMGWNEM